MHRRPCLILCTLLSDVRKPEQFGVLEEEGNDEGPIMPPQHSLSRASSVEVLTEVGGGANGHTSVARAGEEPPLDAAEGEDDPEMLERIESMKRKWPGTSRFQNLKKGGDRRDSQPSNLR